MSYSITLSQTTNFRLFQTEEFADDNFLLDKYGRKFSKGVENTVGKEEIARNEQFLLFLQCFQQACTANTGLAWERDNKERLSPCLVTGIDFDLFFLIYFLDFCFHIQDSSYIFQCMLDLHTKKDKRDFKTQNIKNLRDDSYKYQQHRVW